MLTARRWELACAERILSLGVDVSVPVGAPERAAVGLKTTGSRLHWTAKLPLANPALALAQLVPNPSSRIARQP
jgi:hypothetical protein